jgi:hypothetical protein
MGRRSYKSVKSRVSIAVVFASQFFQHTLSPNPHIRARTGCWTTSSAYVLLRRAGVSQAAQRRDSKLDGRRNGGEKGERTTAAVERSVLPRRRPSSS